jgi:HEAT repeat protein
MNSLRRLILASLSVSATLCQADGVFVWNKESDINEPTQKSIILHDNGREDLVLQVKYEGPASEFGWLVPVPGRPEVRQGSMDCFYELSRLTQERLYYKYAHGGNASEAVKVIEVKTVGAYEVAILAAGNAASLTEWLSANGFVFPSDKRGILDSYIKKQWSFVAVRIDPKQVGFAMSEGSAQKGAAKEERSLFSRQQLANGELHPLLISFPSETCVYPLAISAAGGKPSEISLYVLSAVPLMSRTIFRQEYALYCQKRDEWRKSLPEQTRKARQERENVVKNSPRDPGDPMPDMELVLEGDSRISSLVPGFYAELPLGQIFQVKPAQITACAKGLPRLGDKSWWLTKETEVFSPADMQDLEFAPAAAVLADMLGGSDGKVAAANLADLGESGKTALISTLASTNPNERNTVASALGRVTDTRLKAMIPKLLADAEPLIRAGGCLAAGANWDVDFSPRLVELLRDGDGRVRSAAASTLRSHPDESLVPVYMQIVEEDGAAAAEAITLIGTPNLRTLSPTALVHLLSSTNEAVVRDTYMAYAHGDKHLDVKELEPVLTNSFPRIRFFGVFDLSRMRSKPATDRLVAMLQDSNEGVRWNARSCLRRLTGQYFGADPAAYEQWWEKNRDTFTFPSRSQRGRPMPQEIAP